MHGHLAKHESRLGKTIEIPITRPFPRTRNRGHTKDIHKMPIPPISPELIKALEDLEPPTPPNIKDSDREIWFKAGKRAMVEFLAAEFKAQQSDPNRSIVPSTGRKP
jgi:hypothetical protein